MRRLPQSAPSLLAPLRDAAVVAVAVFFAALALDDITTDLTAPGFVVERVVLLCCATALLVVAVRLLRGGQRLLGGVSLAVLAAAAPGQQALSPGSVAQHPLAYVATVCALLWFATLAIFFVVSAWRGRAAPTRSG
ncbi:MAG: hypothetical protein HGA45_19980 [Chloroflexales bacterium]|nr:hypothetical protein [Chloroflexales bacterium]